ncbi:MAG: DUF2996 domain-containing protein [Cyanosarcina radialis HA8281-LM2]|jgi:hypothetical protein|nr:DUF2996 domain-containing protein [Cyanosarcina radialis HA8281-LM2]
MAEETNQNPAEEQPATPAEAGEEKAAKKPAAKAPKKEKAPAVEDKPFSEFIQQDYLPTLQKALATQGIEDLFLKLEKQKIPVAGFDRDPDCWQVIGNWNRGSRQFNLYFPQEDIQGQRGFSYAENRGQPSTIEPFLIDERKVTLDLLVFGVVQRLNGQKWLGRN